jgi:hypothetical protein
MDGPNSIWSKKAKPDGLNEKGAQKVPKALAPKENRDVRLCSNIPISFASSGRRERF